MSRFFQGFRVYPHFPLHQTEFFPPCVYRPFAEWSGSQLSESSQPILYDNKFVNPRHISPGSSAVQSYESARSLPTHDQCVRGSQKDRESLPVQFQYPSKLSESGFRLLRPPGNISSPHPSTQNKYYNILIPLHFPFPVLSTSSFSASFYLKTFLSVSLIRKNRHHISNGGFAYTFVSILVLYVWH